MCAIGLDCREFVKVKMNRIHSSNLLQHKSVESEWPINQVFNLNGCLVLQICVLEDFFCNLRFNFTWTHLISKFLDTIPLIFDIGISGQLIYLKLWYKSPNLSILYENQTLYTLCLPVLYIKFSLIFLLSPIWFVSPPLGHNLEFSHNLHRQIANSVVGNTSFRSHSRHRKKVRSFVTVISSHLP